MCRPLARRSRSCSPPRAASAPASTAPSRSSSWRSSSSARRSMSATRSSTTASSSTACKAKGAVFVEELDEVPDRRPVIFSAHGVPKSVPAEAQTRDLFYLDATCPLVSKVHAEAARPHDEGLRDRVDRPCRPSRGDRHHGPVAAGGDHLIETVADAQRFDAARPEQARLLTQTTLSVDDTAAIVAALQERASRASSGRATRTSATPPPTARRRSRRSRRNATALIVVGAPNSSNSLRLVEVAERAGCPCAADRSAPPTSTGPDSRASRSVGITAGASAPECWSTRSSTPSARASTSTVETVVDRGRAHRLQRAARVAQPRDHLLKRPSSLDRYAAPQRT